MQGQAAIKDVFLAVAGKQLRTEYFLGLPVGLAEGSYVIDVSRDSLSALPRDGDDSLHASLGAWAGWQGSVTEGRAWEAVLGGPGMWNFTGSLQRRNLGRARNNFRRSSQSRRRHEPEWIGPDDDIGDDRSGESTAEASAVRQLYVSNRVPLHFTARQAAETTTSTAGELGFEPR